MAAFMTVMEDDVRAVDWWEECPEVQTKGCVVCEVEGAFKINLCSKQLTKPTQSRQAAA